MPNLTVKQFRELLQREIAEICDDNGWKVTIAKHKGTAFDIWCAQLISEHDGRYDTDPIDAHVDAPNDLGVDLVFSSTNTGELLVCQCKYLGKSKSVEEQDVTDFLSLHNKLTIGGFTQKYGHSGLADALPVSTIVKSPHKITYRLITNAGISPRTQEIWDARSQSESGPTFELWTRDDLKRLHGELDSREDDSPEEIPLELPIGQYVEISQPRSGIVAVLSTNALGNLWNAHHHSLYAENIRGGLKSNLNQEMRATLANRPADFFYFNNGISATCTDFAIEASGPHRVLKAKGFQVINGAQTLNAIGDNEPQPEGRVLFRLTRIGEGGTSTNIKAEIIRYNNRQNVVKVSDFRSNDAIQKWLEDEFSREPWRWPGVPRRRYARKRQKHFPPGMGKQLKLEELAKIRYAWLYEPRPVIDATGTLFQDSDGGGRYEKAFGVDEEARDKWPRSVLEDAVLAVWFHDAIVTGLKRAVEDIKERNEAKSDGGSEGGQRYEWMMLYRWHFLSLAGIWIREHERESGPLLQSKDGLEDEYRQFMRHGFDVVANAERLRERDEEMGRKSLTMRNWRRSSGEWDRLVKDFRGSIEDARVREDLVSAR